MVSPQDVEALYQHVYRMVSDANQMIKMIDPQSILNGDKLYRFDGRTYKTASREKDLEDFQIHIGKLSILNPLIVVDILGMKTLASGQKRLDVARELKLSAVPCKVIDYDAAFPDEFKNLDENTKSELLKEILTSIVYNESAHTSKIEDEHTLQLMRMVVKNQGLSRDRFKDVKWIFGVKDEEPQYRSLLRLWKIATNQTVCDLLDRKYVRINLFKADVNMRPMMLPKKAELIRRGIVAYVEGLRSEVPLINRTVS